MHQDETVALEIDEQQVVEPRGPTVQSSINSGVAIMEAQRCVLWNFREEEAPA